MLTKKWTNILEKIDFAFQPIVNIRTGELYAVEALLRNYQYTEEFHSIFGFFDEAYQDGSLYQLDIRLREIALQKFKKLGMSNVQLFYNLDNRLLYMPDITYGNTSKILENLELSKQNICFELSERGTITDPSAIRNMVNRYKQEGFTIAIDDFGTGISGLQLLYYTESDFIKIDRFFIHQIETDSKKRLFCQNIINMAHIMGMKVIAEGIETVNEFYTCKDIGADLVQGYFVQKPTTKLKEIKENYKLIRDLVLYDKRLENTNLIDPNNLIYIEPINKNSSMHDLFLYFKEHPENNFVPLINDLRHLVGVIYEKDIKELSYSQYGLSLAKNDKTKKNKIKKFMRECLSVESSWGIDKTLELFNMSDGKYDGVFVTQNNAYKGFINLNNLLKLSYNRNLEIAKNQNPLTKLPGNQQIENYINKAFTNSTNSIYHFVYFDFNDFKPFNDYYGFRQGDRAIMIFSEILQKKSCNNTFIAHIGGDDFFIGIEDCYFEEVYNLVENICKSFKEAVKNLYSKEDQYNGYIETNDRFGVKRKFPLLSVASVITEIHPKSQKDEFDTQLSSLKKIAKKYTYTIAVSI